MISGPWLLLKYKEFQDHQTGLQHIITLPFNGDVQPLDLKETENLPQTKT